jgi:hypothetical protein
MTKDTQSVLSTSNATRDKKCNHHLKCIYCKKEFSPLSSSTPLKRGDSVVIINNITTLVFEEPKKKPNFFHKLLHHFLKNF